MGSSDITPASEMTPASDITLGLWPIAGVTTVGVTHDDADATLAAAIEAGVRRFDTAFSYGYDGESDRRLGRFIAQDRDAFEVIGKVGQRWDQSRKRVIDAGPATLTADAETSLRRLGIEQFDVLMLHAPDPSVPLARSAAAIDQLRRRGLARRIGVCNVDVGQLKVFAGAADGAALQCPLNLLQRDSLADLIPTAATLGYHVDVFWTLMKGLLAGRMRRDHVFPPGDSRPGYAIFQSPHWEHAHDVLDRLRPIAAARGVGVGELAIGWALSQPGVGGVLVGARYPAQIAETARATRLDATTLEQVESAVKQN